jgi:hypothetical protein
MLLDLLCSTFFVAGPLQDNRITKATTGMEETDLVNIIFELSFPQK